MKRTNKIIAIVMLILLFLSSIQNIVIGATYHEDVNIVKIGECDWNLKFKRSDGVWAYITCTYVGYKENGKIHPAYCLNRGLDGVGEYNDYDVNLTHLIDDDRLWRVAINGFPYKTASELGVENDYDAFLATKQAVYSILYNNDVDTYYRADNARGKKILNAIKTMVNEGRNGTYTPQSANVKVTKTGNLKDEGNYYSQEYGVSSRVQMAGYTITNLVNAPEGAFTTDMNNNSKTSFNNSSEHFKVMIPKNSMNKNIDMKVNVQTKCKTYPVFFGKTSIANTQNYLITTDPYGDEAGQGTLNIKTNNAKIIINKTDLDTNQAIDNTTFQLTTIDGKVIANATTNERGVAEFNNLFQNKYVVKEINSNEKYIIDTTERNVDIKYGETKTLNITNKHKEGNLKIIKVDKDNHNIGLGGVVFDLYSKEFKKVIGTYTTDENGEITINNLRIGDFSLIEKKTNKWYNLAENKDVIVKWNTTENTTIENELKKGQVKVIKVDKDNNEVKIAGVKFNVLDENNRVLETIITDQNGEALTSRYPLRDYKNLKLQETETLWNYKLNDKVETVELKENEISTVTFENELKKGQIKVIKVDKDNNEIKLAGVEFEIYNEDSELVDTIVTNENGEAISKMLRIDKEYTIKESKTLSNYVLNKETKTVTLQENQITGITFENEAKKGQVRVIKVDKDNNEIRIAGVEFEIYNEDNELVDTIITNENGEAVSKMLRIDKKYTIKETKTLSNYVLTEKKQTVTLQENQITDITFENEKIKGYIQVTKTSAEDNEYSELAKGSPLADVVFEIYDSEDNLVDTIITDKTGIAVSKELLKGKYKIKEIASAKYYLLNTNTYETEIVNHQEIVNINIENDNVDIDVEIEKKGFVETQSKDNIFYNFSNIKNNSNVPLDNFTWQDTLATNAVRIDKIYTGTWNEELEYSVYYKTNKSEDYILFKDKLNTQKIYELNFKELNLQDDEYVTDYEFRFGTVKVGFQEVESPILYCDMLDNLGNGFVFTNNTKVSGTYFEKYVEDTDKWTTITYYKEIRLDKLPKTRYIE